MKKCLQYDRLSALTLRTLFILVIGLPTLTFGQGTGPLGVNMDFPRFRSSYLAGANINIQATTTTPASTTITKVEFYVATNFFASGSTGTKIGEDLTAPFSLTWTAPAVPAAGQGYQLRAVVTNTTGATAIQTGTGYNRIDIYPTNYVSTRNWYVSAAASATNTAGTEALPFNTIQKAADVVAPGDIVYVMAGTYSSIGTADVVALRRTGTPSAWIEFRNYQNDKPKLTFTGYQGFNLLPASAYIKIQGFEIVGNNANVTLPQALTQPGSCLNPTGTVNPIFNGNGISLNGRNGGNLRPHHAILANNIVHDCGGGGIITIESDYVTIENNTIYNTSWYTVFGTSAISFLNSWNFDTSTDTKMIVRNNRCYGNRLYVRWVGAPCKTSDGNGIIVDNNNVLGGGSANNPLGDFTGRFLIENNLTYLNGGRGININNTSNVIVLNNTSYLNAQTDATDLDGNGTIDTDLIEGEFVIRNSSGSKFYNNIFYGLAGKAVNRRVNSPDLVHNNNLTFGGTGTPILTGAQNLTGVEPLFVDAANGDFQLVSNSPALNAGNSTPGQFAAKDILGIDRPQGPGVDIGAYELQGTPISITQQPASGSAVCAGAAVSVSVGVSATAQAYQWYKDGVILTGVTSATTATLSLPATTATDQGSYLVVVTGFNSVTSTAFVLTVNAIPTASLTASGTISCTTPIVTLTGSSTGGVNYTFSGPSVTAQSSNTATVTQAGTYSVLITSAEGCATSATVGVTGGLTTPDAPNVSSVSAIQGTGTVNLTVSNCASTISWNGVEAGTSFPVSISAVGAFVYSVTCKVGVCVSPATSVTVTVNAPPSSLSVFHRDGDNNQTTNNVIRPYLKLTNDGTTAVPYSEITIRYWLTVENFAPLTNLSVYWAQLGTNKVRMSYVPLAQPRQGAFGYIEYSFDASAGTLAAGSNSGEIQTGVGKQNWTNFTESDDHSFAPNAGYTKNDRITIYRNGTLVGGVEPASITPVTALKVYSENKNGNPNTNQISTHLKVANEGNLPVDYGQVTVRYWFSSEGANPLVYSLDFAELGNGKINSKFVKENRAGTDTYLELSFVPTLGQLNPLSSTGIIQQRINKNDWSNFNEANDYSYKVAGPLAENTKITAYINGSLVYGQEPAPSGARVGTTDEPSAMRVVVLGNPVQGESVSVEVSGVEGQPLRLVLTDVQGRIVSTHQTERAGFVEKYQLSITPKQVGILLLDVSTGREKQTLRLLKQ